MPFKLFFLFNGLLWLVKTMKDLHFPMGKVAIPILTGFILINSLNGYLLNMSKSPASSLSYQKPIFNKDGLNPLVSESAYLKAMRWLRNNTPASAQVMAENPKDVKLLSQRYAHPLQRSKAPAHLKRHIIKHTDYIIEEPNSPVSKEYLSPTLQRYPNSFRLVYNDTHAQVRIWKVLAN